MSAPPSLLQEDGSESNRCAQGSVFSSLKGLLLDQSSVTVAMAVTILVFGTRPIGSITFFFNLLRPVTMKLGNHQFGVGMVVDMVMA